MQTFGPTLDNTIERELNGFATLVRAVEDSAVDEGTLIVYFDSLLSGRFRAFALNEYFVLQTRFGHFDLFAQCVLLEELLACSFSLTVFETVDDLLYIRVGSSAVHLIGVFVKTIDETLLEEFEVSLQTIDTEQTYGLLLADSLTDILRHCYDLRVAYIFFHALVDILNELLFCVTHGIFGEDVHTDLLTVHETEGVVERVDSRSQFDGFCFARAFGVNNFACFHGTIALVARHKETLRLVFRHNGSVLVEGVNYCLEEDTLVQCPVFILSQTVLLEGLDGHAELTTRLLNLAQGLFFALISYLEGVNKLCYGCIAAVVSQETALDLQTIEQTQRIVDGVCFIL